MWKRAHEQERDEVPMFISKTEKDTRMRHSMRKNKRPTKYFGSFVLWNNRFALLVCCSAFVVFAFHFILHSLVIYSPLVYGSCRKKPNHRQNSHTLTHSLACSFERCYTMCAAPITIPFAAVSVRRCMFSYETNAAYANALPKDFKLLFKWHSL